LHQNANVIYTTNEYEIRATTNEKDLGVQIFNSLKVEYQM